MFFRYLKWFLGLLVFLAVAVVVWFNFSEFSRWLLFLLVCFVLAMIRIIRGPTPADRAVATDILGIFIVGACAVLSIYLNKTWYMDIAIAWALQSFIGILALAKFLEGRRFDD